MMLKRVNTFLGHSARLAGLEGCFRSEELMAYNAKKAKSRRTLNTGAALRGMFGNRKRKPCKYCGASLTLEQATFDHVRALSAGGYDKRKNGAIACRTCNSRKGSMTPEQFLALLRDGAAA